MKYEKMLVSLLSYLIRDFMNLKFRFQEIIFVTTQYSLYLFKLSISC